MIDFNKETRKHIDILLDNMKAAGSDAKKLKIVVPIAKFLISKYKSKYGYHDIEYSTDINKETIYLIPNDR